jgi:hypothetical protein
MDPLINLVLWVVQILVAYIVLTSFGAMWSGVQKKSGSSSALAWFWSVGVVIALNLLDRLDDYFHAYGGWVCR